MRTDLASLNAPIMSSHQASARNMRRPRAAGLPSATGGATGIGGTTAGAGGAAGALPGRGAFWGFAGRQPRRPHLQCVLHFHSPQPGLVHAFVTFIAPPLPSRAFVQGRPATVRQSRPLETISATRATRGQATLTQRYHLRQMATVERHGYVSIRGPTQPEHL